jgi:hypothetical protein
MGAQQDKSVIAFERWRVGYYFTGAKEKDLFFTASFTHFFYCFLFVFVNASHFIRLL